MACRPAARAAPARAGGGGGAALLEGPGPLEDDVEAAADLRDDGAVDWLLPGREPRSSAFSQITPIVRGIPREAS